MLAPVLPEIGERTGTGPGVAGALVASFAVGQLVGFPLAGLLAHRRSSAALLGVSLALLLVGDAMFVLGEGLDVWFPARVVQGLGAAGLWIGVTLAVLERWPESSYQRLTGILAAYSVGAICGPAIGAIEGVRGPFLAHALLTIVTFAPLLVLGSAGTRAELGTDRSVLRTRAFGVSAAGIVLLALAAGTIDGPIPLHLAERLGQTEIAAMYILTSVFVAVGSLAAGRVRPRLALAAGAAMVPVGIGLVGLASAVGPWAGGLGLAGAGFGLGEAGAIGILLAGVARERIVTAWVVWSQLWAVGYLVGPAVAGIVAEAWGYSVLGVVPLAGSLAVAWALQRK